jgi:septum formation inhibitor MinC
MENLTAPNLPKSIEIEDMNLWAQERYSVPTFNQLSSEQIQEFDQMRQSEWDSYKKAYAEYNEKKAVWAIKTIEQTYFPSAKQPEESKAINPHQAHINKWKEAGIDDATIEVWTKALDSKKNEHQKADERIEKSKEKHSIKRKIQEIERKIGGLFGQEKVDALTELMHLRKSL